MPISNEVLAAHRVLVASDNAFQRAARLRQALWRERNELPMGEHRGKPLGSRLAMPFAKVSLANFMSETIRRVVRTEVIERPAGTEQVYQEPRIFNDLLSSQPLCFNLFGELQQDLDLSSRVIADLLDVKDARVQCVRFEYSPGRGDPAFTRDHSAFDVFMEYESGGLRRFLGIEVKYVENMAQAPARFRPRYAEVAHTMGCFRPDRIEALRAAPLEQLWRDHLLVGSLAAHPDQGFAAGTFVVLYPEGNDAVVRAVEAYAECLRDDATIRAWTLERFLDAVGRQGRGCWAAEVRGRYLEDGVG